MRVLLLGATGAIGRRTASELLRHAEMSSLTLAGRDADKLERTSAALRGGREIRVQAFDVTSPGEAERHFQGHDVVVSCAGPGYRLESFCVEAAIAAQVSYFSLNDDFEAIDGVIARSHEAAEAGIIIVSGCGAAPGLTNMLVALASSELDRLDEVEISVAASSQDAAGPATDLHFIAMMDAAAPGRAGTDRSRTPHPVYFPDPVGWVETFPCPHPEELSISKAHPTLTAVRFRIGLVEKAVMDVVRAGVAARLTGGEARRRLWLKMAQPTRPLLERASPHGSGWTALRVDVRGQKGTRSKTLSYGVVDHLINLASIPLTQAILDASLQQAPGVRFPEELFEPKTFLRQIAGRGIRFGQLEPHNW